MRLRVAVVGAGSSATVHMRVLQRLSKYVRLVALADCNLALAEQAESEFGLESVTSDWRELMADPSIDVIHNCTPPHLHHSINSAALHAGKHVLSEQPLAFTLDEGLHMTRVASEKGLHAAVNFCYRYYPVIQEAIQRAKRGDLGQITTIQGHFFQDTLLSQADYNWRMNPSQAGASSVISDLGAHWFDLVQMVTGQRIAAVMADMHTVFPTRMVGGASKECPLEDIGTVLIRLENGAVGTFVTSQMAPGRKRSLELQVYGTKTGLAWSHDRANELWLGRRVAPNEVLGESHLLQTPESQAYCLNPVGAPMGYMDAVYNLFCEFYRTIHTGKGTYPSFEDALTQIQILHAAVTSVRRERWEEVGQIETATCCAVR